MSDFEQQNFDPYTAERAFSFQIANRAAEVLGASPEPDSATELAPKPLWLAQQAVQGAFENPYVVTRGN